MYMYDEETGMRRKMTAADVICKKIKERICSLKKKSDNSGLIAALTAEDNKIFDKILDIRKQYEAKIDKATATLHKRREGLSDRIKTLQKAEKERWEKIEEQFVLEVVLASENPNKAAAYKEILAKLDTII